MFIKKYGLILFVLLLGAGVGLAQADEHIEAACTLNLLAVTPDTALTYVCGSPQPVDGYWHQ